MWKSSFIKNHSINKTKSFMENFENWALKAYKALNISSKLLNWFFSIES